MKHDDVKKLLLSDLETKMEYEDLELEYSIKEHLIKLRIENKLSQSELAQKIGTKQSAIARLESGRHSPSVNMLAKIANATGKELVIGFKEKKHNKRKARRSTR